MMNNDIMWNSTVIDSMQSATSATIIGDTETSQMEPISASMGPNSSPKEMLPFSPLPSLYDEEWSNLMEASKLELIDNGCHQELEDANKKIACVIHDHIYHATSPPQLERLPEQLREAEHAEKLRRKEAHKINERKRRAELREAFSIMQELLCATNATDNDTLLMAIDEIKTLEEQAEEKLKKIIRLKTRHQQLLIERVLENIDEINLI